MIDDRVRVKSRKTLVNFIELVDESKDNASMCIQVTVAQFIGKTLQRVYELIEEHQGNVTYDHLITAQIIELNQCIEDLRLISERKGATIQ